MPIDSSLLYPDAIVPRSQGDGWKRSFSLIRERIWSTLSEYSSFQEVNRAIPIVVTSEIDEKADVLQVSFVTSSAYTQGGGRGVADILSTYLVPGSYVPISYSHACRFRVDAPGIPPLFFNEYHIDLPHKDDIPVLRANLPNVKRMIRFAMLGTIFTRKIMEKRSHHPLEREVLFAENIADLFTINRNVKSPSLVNELGAHGMYPRPHSTIPFRRDIFHEMQHMQLQFPHEFAATYHPKTIIRILSYSYLFRKIVSFPGTDAIEKQPSCFRMITMRPKEKGKATLHGILFTFDETLFDKQFTMLDFFKLCQSCSPGLIRFSPHCFQDTRSGSSIISYFLAVQKHDGRLLSLQERVRFISALEKALLSSRVSTPETSLHIKQPVPLHAIEHFLLEKGVFDEVLFAHYIREVEKTVASASLFATGYFMLHTLQERDTTRYMYHTSVQSKEGTLLLAICSESQTLTDNLEEFLHTLIDVPFVLFPCHALYFTLIFLSEDDPERVNTIRSELMSLLHSSEKASIAN